MSGRVDCDVVVSSDQYRSDPEYILLAAALAPLLGKVLPRNLTDDDLAVLECVSKQPLARLLAYRSAWQIFEGSKVPAGAVYGLIREGLPSTRPELFSQSGVVLTAALTAAVAARIAPAMTASEIAAAVQTISALRVTDAIAAKNPASLSPLLKLAVPSQAVQAEIVRASVGFQGNPDTFWDATLSQLPGLSGADTRNRVELVAGIGALTFGHAPLAGALLSANSPIQVGSLRDLAKLQPADWTSLINSQVNGVTVGVPVGVPGATDAEKAEQFAQAIAKTVATNMPTAALAAALARTNTAALQVAGAMLDQQPDLNWLERRWTSNLCSERIRPRRKRQHWRRLRKSSGCLS